MKTGKKTSQVVVSIVLTLFQIAIGLLGFVISGKLSHNTWLLNMLFLWLGVTLGIYISRRHPLPSSKTTQS
jgi:hypothetical protein